MNARNSAQAPATSRHLKPRWGARRAAQETLDARPVGRHAQAPSVLIWLWHVALAVVAKLHPAQGVAQLRKLAHRAQHRMPGGGRGAVAIGVSAALLVSVFIVPVVAASDAAADPAEGALVHGVLMVDANDDGEITDTGRVGELDLPLAGAAVTLQAPDSKQTWTTTTAADGTWAFPEEEVDDVGPDEQFVVTIDVKGVSEDAYVMSTNPLRGLGSGDVFTPMPTNRQLAISKPFSATEVALELNALAVPTRTLELALTSNSDGVDGRYIVTGSSPFDDDDEPGNDSESANKRVRSGDVVAFEWGVTATAQVSLTKDVPNVTFEQTIDLGEGAKVNFTARPAQCPAGVITALPGNQVVEPRTDPPAGTTTLVLTCNLGTRVSTAAHLVQTGIWVSGNSDDTATFSTTARVAAADATSGAALARPAQEATVDELVITAVPRFDLKQWGFMASGHALVDFDNDPSTPQVPVAYVQSTVTIAAERQFGTAAFKQPIKIEDAFWATTTGPKGIFVDGLQYRISGCGPAGGQTKDAVYGYQHANWAENQSVSNSGSCTVERAKPSDLTSNYTLTLDGIDTSAARYPTRTVGGDDLSAGPFYVASYVITFQVPYTELEKFGDLAVYNRVGDFDPDGLTGPNNNYGSGVEPGYCPPGDASEGSSRCATMDDLDPATPDERSNNVVGPTVIQITGGGGLTLTKMLADPQFAWRNDISPLPGATYHHDGSGQVQPGEVHGSRLNVGTESWSGASERVEVCDVFDNSVATLAPLNKISGLTDPHNVGDGVYSYVTRGSNVALSKELDKQYTVHYGHVDLSEDSSGGELHVPTNRLKGDWTQQSAAHCGMVNEADWEEDPGKVGAGIEDVNIVRLTSNDGADPITPGNGIAWWLAFEQRDTFHGGSNDGNLIPAGTVFANFGRYRSDSTDGWNNPSYFPGAGRIGTVESDAESSSHQGDRWTVTRAMMALSMRTVDATVDGVPAEGAAPLGQAGVANAGSSVVWEVAASVNSRLGSPQNVGDVVITVVLPEHVTYNEEQTAVLAGEGLPTPVDEVNADGTTTLTWTLKAWDSGKDIPPLQIVTDTNPWAPHDTTLVGTATITAEALVPLKSHSDDHSVRLVQAGELKMELSVDDVLDLVDDSQEYTLDIWNVSQSRTIDAPTVINLLPSQGDGGTNVGRVPASEYHGTNTLSGEPVATVPGKFYYTTVAVESVPQTKNDDTNPLIWVAELPDDLSLVTAFKFVADGPLTPASAEGSSGLKITYSTKQDGNAAGDVYANRFTVASDTLRDDTGKYLLMAPNQTTVRIVGFSLGDLIWIEKDLDGTYTEGVDLTAPKDVKVEVYRANSTPGDDDPVRTATTDANGRWVVHGLPVGDYFAYIPAQEFTDGGALAGLVAYPYAETDANLDTNEDAGHNGIGSDGGVRTATIILNAETAGGNLAGGEPLGDNTGGLHFSSLVTDDFTNLTLDIALYQGLDKTVSDRDDVALGDEVVWTVASGIPVPADPGTSLSGYKITDALDAKLDFVSATVSLSGEGAPPLYVDAHYEVTSPSTGGGTLVTIEFTGEGLTVLAANSDRRVVVDITTKVNAVGEIQNTATVFHHKPGSDWAAGHTTPEAGTRWGKVDVHKTDGKRNLEGATFQLWAEVDGKPKERVVVNGVNTWTTDGEGKLTIAGLRYSRFADGAELTAEGQPFEDGYIQYWLEEVKAPPGHELLAEMIPFEVDDVDADIELEVTNVPANAGFDLPPLGGLGSAASYRWGLLIVSSVLVLALLVEHQYRRQGWRVLPARRVPAVPGRHADVRLPVTQVWARAALGMIAATTVARRRGRHAGA